MKSKTSLLLLAIFSLIITQACTNDEAEEPPQVHFENSNLEVKVRIETDTGLINAIGAQIFLYKNKENRMEDYKVAYEGVTNAEGKYLFTALAEPEYWILVKSSFDGEVKLFNDDSPYRTPGHPVTVNKLDVLFEQ